MRLRTKISLGILIGGIALIGCGVPLFAVGGAGTKSLFNYNNDIEISSGYFNQKEFWDSFSTIDFGGGETFTEKFANDNGYSYNVIGLAKCWYDIESKKENPPIPPIIGDEGTYSLNEVLDFFKAIPIDNSLFIAGAVLWPIGATVSIISGLLFFIFYRKDKQE